MVGNVANMTAVPGNQFVPWLSGLLTSSRPSCSFPLYSETKPKAKKSLNTGTSQVPETLPKIILLTYHYNQEISKVKKTNRNL